MKKIWIIVAIIVIIIGIFAIKSLTGKSIQEQGVKEFTIKAFRYGYDPNTITINKGDKVKITIDNTDAPHGIQISAFGVQGVDSIEFTADKSGEFEWHCYIPCGPGHAEMTGKLIVK